MQNPLWTCLIHAYNPIFEQNTWHIVYDMYMGLNWMEKFENMMSDCSELKRDRSQRWWFGTWDTGKIKIGWVWWENKRRERFGNQVMSAIGTFCFDPTSWGVLAGEDHISVLGWSLDWLSKCMSSCPHPGIQLSSPLPSTIHQQSPNTWLSPAQPKGFLQLISDTMKTYCEQCSTWGH